MEDDDEPQKSPKPICCFGFSSKRTNERKVMKNSKAHGIEEPNKEWERKDGILSDMSTFSVKEQERRLKMALEEEEKVAKEAERVVQRIKQESARMNDSTIKKIVADYEVH
ncbi:hypothetical protein L484_022743 [Morus notabilis]|uniref:Uncharacterized protein n=1 Tax=Morus notabilis TaxID=981085 RepID=W9SCC6_9ROSA|nr:hypothetical protein L484_022743 [Morus notabilis]